MQPERRKKNSTSINCVPSRDTSTSDLIMAQPPSDPQDALRTLHAALDKLSAAASACQDRLRKPLINVTHILPDFRNPSGIPPLPSSVDQPTDGATRPSLPIGRSTLRRTMD